VLILLQGTVFQLADLQSTGPDVYGRPEVPVGSGRRAVGRGQKAAGGRSRTTEPFADQERWYSLPTTDKGQRTTDSRRLASYTRSRPISRSMRFGIGGWVENRLVKISPVVSGWQMNMWAIDGETCIGTRLDHWSIFCKARARP